ncbi:MAG: hydantoinase B/oxoprolinase family protein, partial [Nitratireductor sp.]
AQIRAVIDALPPGPFFGLDGLDPTPGLPDIDVHARLTCADGHFDVDFTGTTPQVAAPINCVRSGPLAAVFYALLSLAGPALLRNGGVLRAIRLTLPEACIINARPPAAVNARMGVVRATTSAVLQAVAQAAPEQMPAANSGMSYVLAFSGRNDDGAPFLVTEIIAGGAGGGPRSDGAPGISTDVGNAMNMPAEALEGMIPVRLVSAQIRQGSGGAGRYRGGDGICRVYEALADAIAVSLRGERFHRAPEGLRGGSAPAHSQARILRANGTQDVLSSRSAVTLDKGDRLVVESCGGAGYGAPGIG